MGAPAKTALAVFRGPVQGAGQSVAVHAATGPIAAEAGLAEGDAGLVAAAPASHTVGRQDGLALGGCEGPHTVHVLRPGAGGKKSEENEEERTAHIGPKYVFPGTCIYRDHRFPFI